MADAALHGAALARGGALAAAPVALTHLDARGQPGEGDGLGLALAAIARHAHRLARVRARARVRVRVRVRVTVTVTVTVTVRANPNRNLTLTLTWRLSNSYRHGLARRSLAVHWGCTSAATQRAR